MARPLLSTLVCALLCSVSVATAASLGGIASPRLGAGSSVVLACDGNGVSTSYTTSGGEVTSVTVGGLADPACEGAQVSQTLVSSTDASLGSVGPTTVGVDAGTADSSVTLSTSAQPDAAAVAGVHVLVEGP
jgi:hypothetical protein